MDLGYPSKGSINNIENVAGTFNLWTEIKSKAADRPIIPVPLIFSSSYSATNRNSATEICKCVQKPKTVFNIPAMKKTSSQTNLAHETATVSFRVTLRESRIVLTNNNDDLLKTNINIDNYRTLRNKIILLSIFYFPSIYTKKLIT